MSFQPISRASASRVGSVAESEVWVTDCPLAALQFGQHAGVRALHPLTVLARAYRADGFERRIERGPGDGKGAEP